MDNIGGNTLGKYSRKTQKITIKCPKDESEMTKLYGTISHEATHYAMDLVEDKGIIDNETTAYIVGYVTREIIKRNDCPINK